MARWQTIRLDTGQFWQANGTVQREWVNGPYASGQTPVTFKILRVSLWGGMSIGANMDFSAAAYVTGQGWFYQDQGASEWTPLAYMSLDRYGISNGQPYQSEWDWSHIDSENPLVILPNQRVILQANCVQHGGTNPVFGTPAANDNAHAQMYIWLRALA